MKMLGMMIYIGDSRGWALPEPKQKKSTKSSWWKSVKKYLFADGEICQKMKHYSFYSVISAIWDRSKCSNLILAPKFKSIRPSFSVITTPFSVNAHFCICVQQIESYQSKSFPLHFKFPKGWYIILRGLRNGAEIILIEKTQTVEHKCNCAFTEKGVVITLKARTNRFEFWRQNKVRTFDLSQYHVEFFDKIFIHQFFFYRSSPWRLCGLFLHWF